MKYANAFLMLESCEKVGLFVFLAYPSLKVMPDYQFF